ncbi:cytochrome c oxidase subunit 5B, mitochondrial-like [Armigeres subalbatus]|uniref:cytochrome c oxidase subunit 5B, mitochondrial-like n=1 Tax=Armigeres subalbatus TaxID=124917 RepID=UPI002ED43353
MASLCGRKVLNAARRNITCTPVRFCNAPIEHATGLEKRELLARQAGNNDPFDMRVFKCGPGTKEGPNMIPSVFESRLSRQYGSVCEKNQTYIQGCGCTKRCDCGHWFKLIEKAPSKRFVEM